MALLWSLTRLKAEGVEHLEAHTDWFRLSPSASEKFGETHGETREHELRPESRVGRWKKCATSSQSTKQLTGTEIS